MEREEELRKGNHSDFLQPLSDGKRGFCGKSQDIPR